VGSVLVIKALHRPGGPIVYTTMCLVGLLVDRKSTRRWGWVEHRDRTRPCRIRITRHRATLPFLGEERFPFMSAPGTPCQGERLTIDVPSGLCAMCHWQVVVGPGRATTYRTGDSRKPPLSTRLESGQRMCSISYEACPKPHRRSRFVVVAKVE